MERIDFRAKRLKGQCRQEFELLENLTEVLKFVLIPSVIIHKKTRGDRKDWLERTEAKFVKFRYVLKLKTPLILVCCDLVLLNSDTPAGTIITKKRLASVTYANIKTALFVRIWQNQSYNLWWKFDIDAQYWFECLFASFNLWVPIVRHVWNWYFAWFRKAPAALKS